MQTILDLLYNNIDTISAFIIGIGVVSFFLLKARGLLRELAEALIAIDEALKDNKITKEEIADIKKEFLDIWESVKKFRKK